MRINQLYATKCTLPVYNEHIIPWPPFVHPECVHRDYTYFPAGLRLARIPIGLNLEFRKVTVGLEACGYQKKYLRYPPNLGIATALYICGLMDRILRLLLAR